MLSALIVEDEPLIREYLRSNLNHIHKAHAQLCWDLYLLVLGVCLEASQILRKK